MLVQIQPNKYYYEVARNDGESAGTHACRKT